MTTASTRTGGVARAVLIWVAVVAAVALPIGAAVASPLLAWRDAIYITAGLAGVIALALMLIQPLLMSGLLPGFAGYRGRRAHLWVGSTLVFAVIVHVAGLWLTSPPDVVDALLFRSPTPFSAWGVIAMWAVFVVALLVAVRGRLGLRPRTWRTVHTAIVAVIVVCTVVHTLLIEGTMEVVSKVALCALVVIAAAKAIIELRMRRNRTPERAAPRHTLETTW